MTDEVLGNQVPAGSEQDAQGGAGSAPVQDAPQGAQDGQGQPSVTELQEALKKMERDMDRMRSTYDRQAQTQIREYESQLSAADRRVDEVLMSQLEGEDRLKYERDRAREQAQALRDQLEQERIRTEELQQLTQYRQFFDELGLDHNNIDYSNLEAMGATAFPAIADLVTQLREKATATPQVQQNVSDAVQNFLGPNANQPAPTPLMTQQGQVPSQGPRTVPELMNAISKQLGYEVSEEDVGRLIQRGILDESIFNSLDPNLMY